MRRRSETVDITLPDGTVVEVMVVEVMPGIDGGQDRVRLGFVAPRDVTIDRSEITRRKVKAKAEAKR